MANLLTLFFGPRLPHELEHIGIAFVSAPTLQPDFAVGTLSAQRYVSQNYPHIEKHTLIDGSTAEQTVDVSLVYQGTDVNGLYSSTLSFQSSGSITLSEDDYGVQTLNSPIKVRGITITRAGSWAASLVPGTVIRPHVISEREPDDSWVKRCMTAVGTGEIAVGDLVYLIYTIPEAAYGSRQTSTSETFPGAEAEMRQTRQVGRAVNPNTIGYEGSLKIITAITVNGVTKFPTVGGQYDGTTDDPYIKRLDVRNRQIEIYDSLGPNDHIVIEALELAETYDYLGYRDYTGTWYGFDANPEYGHFTRDDRTGGYQNSASLLLEEITIYLVPSALFTVHIPPLDEEADPSYAGQATIRFHSAFNYGETHFVRHKVGGVADEEIVSRANEGSTNTWGHAKLGLNHYDEGVYFPDDVFDPNRPSSMPLGRIVLSAPIASRSVAVADIRQRGGGVPEEFPMTAVNAEEDGLDRLRMHWDMGIWEGKAIKEGGVIEIRIDPSVLDTFTSAEIERRVRSEIPPGINYEIKYVAV